MQQPAYVSGIMLGIFIAKRTRNTMVTIVTVVATREYGIGITQ